MVKNERLIKFPVPDWNRVTSEKFDVVITCFSYQYDFDENFYGPYGFDTPVSQDIIHSIFKNVYYYDGITNKFSTASTFKKKGLYFFDGFKQLKFEVENYQLALKKNEYKNKKGLESDVWPVKPFLVDSIRNDQFEDSFLLKLMNDNVGFFIVNHYSSEAGQCILVFSSELCCSFSDAAKKYNIEINEIESINVLKSW